MVLSYTERNKAGAQADIIDERIRLLEELIGGRVKGTHVSILLSFPQADELIRLAKIGRAKEYLDEAERARVERDDPPEANVG